MKTSEKIFLVLRPLTLAMVLISLEAIMLFSCQKDENVNTDDVEETSDTPDERTDLIAFLDPVAGVLWADLACLETTLSLLGATPIHENKFVKQGITPSGKPVEIRF